MVHEKNINSGVCNASSRVIEIISQLKMYEMNIEIKKMKLKNHYDKLKENKCVMISFGIKIE